MPALEQLYGASAVLLLAILLAWLLWPQPSPRTDYNALIAAAQLRLAKAKRHKKAYRHIQVEIMNLRHRQLAEAGR